MFQRKSIFFNLGQFVVSQVNLILLISKINFIFYIVQRGEVHVL